MARKRKHASRRPGAGVWVFFGVVALLVLLLAGLIVLLLNGGSGDTSGGMPAAATPNTAPAVETSATPTPTPSPTPSPTAVPTPTPGPGAFTVQPDADAAPADLGVESIAIQNGAQVQAYQPETPLFMGLAGEYAQLEGVTTFRGNNYRDSAAYGTIPEEPEMQIAWTVDIGEIDDWGGIGWTGQCAIVRWPQETLQIMNIREEKKAKADLKEVIYAALDGNIYFLDLEDGQPTRDPISIGAPIKGSVTVDPRGYPLLYVGQGLDEAEGESVDIGTRIFSLIDQSLLYFLDGEDEYALRDWYAFDAAPLVDGKTDTMLQVGENAILYLVHLNTDYDPAAGTISIAPEVDRYVFRSSISEQPGMENSIAVYNQYGYFADNSGLLQCVNLNTLTCEWARDVDDDTDATIVLEQDADGAVALYTATELEHSASVSDYAYLRKFDALTGRLLWELPVRVRTSEDDEGGAFATPALGKGDLGNLVYIQMTRTPSDGATLLAVDKQSGEVAWDVALGSAGWSSPVCVYTPSGKGYVIVGSSSGALRLYDGLNGRLTSICDLDGNIEGSPAVFDDMIVVGTRSRQIFGVRILGEETA